MSGAERLREAAKVMRERAEAATGSPWQANSKRDDRNLGVSVDIGGAIQEGSGSFVAAAWGWGPIEENAAHIASWHPAVALAVADLLDVWADHDLLDSSGSLAEEKAAILALADAYLGSPS